MSKFLSDKYKKLEAYVPGEQPVDKKYIKLNTNESPYPPSPEVSLAVKCEGKKLNLYSDPEVKRLLKLTAQRFSVSEDMVLLTNGSDEILDFAFMAFCDGGKPIAFPDISYGFYSVFANLYGIPYKEIPLDADFNVNYRDYLGVGANIVIANPNAPTGTFMPIWQIEEILKSNPENIVIIDEAYIDFGAESAISLIPKYENLLVTQTFSKSRSLAGARLGFGIANSSVIADLKKIKYSRNPYNVNRMTMAAGCAVLENDVYYMDNCKKIESTRAMTKKELESLGFFVLDSMANFLFAKSDNISGEELYLKLKDRGILVRHFKKPRISEFNRITVGTDEEMKALLLAIKDILKEKCNESI